MIAKLEQFVHRLVEDQTFREMAKTDPDAAVALFGLTGPERHGALKLCAQTAGASKIGSMGFWI